MGLTNEGGTDMVMPVSPMYGSGYGNGGNNGWGGDGWWILLLFLLAGNGGWGNGFGGGFGAGNELYPWMNQAEITSDGFRDQMMNSNIDSIQNSVNSLSTQLCNCCADMNQTVSNGFAQAEIAANGRQMANMNQAFAAQTAMSNGFNQLGSQLADCCCENRLATADLKYTIATEECATRSADAMNTRDIIDSQTRGTQTILDKLCQLELDGKNDKIADLERQLTMANFAASQTAQNAFIAQGLNSEVDALYNRLKNCPVPSMPVYGMTPVFTCNNNACGCGCGSNLA